MVCNKCKIDKPLVNFYFRKDTNSHRKQCIQCRKSKDGQYYQANRDKIIAQAKDYYKENKERVDKVHEAWDKKNPDKIAEYQKKSQLLWKKNNRHKMRAHWAVNGKIKTGELKKPSNCESCGAGGRIEGHHHKGYDKENYLELMWLCSTCHKKEHRDVKKNLGKVRQ